MPEQTSRRGVAITASPYEAPFDTPVIRLGARGLDLLHALDQIPPDRLSRFTNAVHEGDTGQLRSRLGQTALTTPVPGAAHSIRRMNSPRTGTFTRVWGIGASLYTGASGALTAVDTGYSGDPLTLVPYRPPLSADTWMYVADRTRTRKVRASDSLDLPISPVPPTLAASTALEAEQRTPIAAFDSSDATDAAQWVGTPGFGFGDSATLPAGTVTILGAAPAPGGGAGAVAFRGHPGQAGNPFAPHGYWYMAGLSKALNLSTVGIYPAADDDLIHLALYLSHVEFITEVRLYFVCSETFSASVLPGTSDLGTNADFYVKGFSAHDFAQAVLIRQTLVEAAETARVHDIRDQSLRRRRPDDDRASWEIRRAERDPARSIAPQGPAGNAAWTAFGVLGVPLRRGDFQRVGSTEGRDWATITGIIVYVAAGPKSAEVEVHLDDCYLHGGSGPDTAEPGAQPYDYRYTHYDPRTGDETNPSPEQDASLHLDTLRRAITVQPAASGDPAMRQRIYRRGGSLIADWFFCGETDSDGGSFQDRLTDAGISAAGTVELDNDEFLTTVDETGATIRAQAAPVIFGPVEDLLLALGDPYQPGHVYWSKPGQPGSWPASNTVEVCPPGEVLQNGGLWAGQAFCFSQERLYWLYPNLAAANQVSASPSACARGMLTRWGLTIAPIGIVFLNEDGIYVTTGGPPDLLSRDIDPLFHGQSSFGLRPVDLTAATALRLETHDNEIWFAYQDDQGARQVLIYHILGQYWRHYQFGITLATVYSDEGGADLLFGGTDGTGYTHSGTSDAGTAISGHLRTGALDYGRPREDKLFGDLIVEAELAGVGLDVQTFLNAEAIINPVTTLAGTARERYVFDPFGISPQKARTLSLDLRWSSATARPTLFLVGASIIPQPDLTVNRVTQWEDLSHPDEVYLTGLTLDVDTGNVARQFFVEYDLEGQHLQLGPFTVQAANRHKFKFSWPAVKAHLVRIRPIGDCLAWILYRADWIFDPEPPRIAGWDINHENPWDAYITGFDLECNTFGQTKTIQFWLDQSLIQTYPVTASGRRVVHCTVQPPRRGHVLRFVATDAHPGLLYAHRWHFDQEPSEQTNWNQNFTIAGALPDKYLKGILLECDTFGQTKTVTLEVDGVVVETLAVNTPDRRVTEFSFPQHLGRVFRLLPVDNFPGRLYSHQWIFDQEPLKLTRWETQELDHDIPGFQTLLFAQLTLKSATPVRLTVTVHTDQTGRRQDLSLEIPSTGGVKQKRFVPVPALKGVLFKYVLTATEAFWLYREESQVILQPWGAERPITVRPFGNDDLDRTRGMVNAQIAAAQSGGGT